MFLFLGALRLMRRNRYDLIHAVEEAGFIALFLQRLFRVPFVLDVDSSMTTQLAERFHWMRHFSSILEWLESRPARRALAVVPMCEDLAVRARRHSRGIVFVLKDVSLLDNATGAEEVEDLRLQYAIDGPILMYVGNLEEYQGIDLLLESFAMMSQARSDAHLLIIGGSDEHIDKYRRKAEVLRVGNLVHFTGRKPVANLSGYLKQSDLLVSPRTHGTNTPMKIYSYLDSGVPVLATRLPTHTQVVTENEAALVSPDAHEMAETMQSLLNDHAESARLSRNARDLIAKEHSLSSFRANVDALFVKIEERLAATS